MGWWSDLFSSNKKPEQKTEPTIIMIDVGKAEVTVIENDGEVHHLTIHGTMLNTGYGRIKYSASMKFDSWRSKAGETGMASLHNNTYVPLCNIKKINVEYLPFEVEVKSND